MMQKILRQRLNQLRYFTNLGINTYDEVNEFLENEYIKNQNIKNSKHYYNFC
jgi:hypothetical protein